MNNLLKNGLSEITRAGRKAVRDVSSEASIRSLRNVLGRGRMSAGDATAAVVNSQAAQKTAVAVRTAVSAGPVRELAVICGRAGVAGAVVDGALGGVHAAKLMRDGKIDSKQAVMHVGAEAGCGFVTSTAGTAGTLAAYMLIGSMGPAALVAGMGASLGSRYVYRRVVGETLPETESAEKRNRDEDSDPMEDIGPRPQ